MSRVKDPRGILFKLWIEGANGGSTHYRRYPSEAVARETTYATLSSYPKDQEWSLDRVVHIRVAAGGPAHE